MNSVDSKDIVKRGFLEKHGGKGIMATWQTRWFVLTNDNLSYFVDQSLAVKKGEIALNHLCTIKRKAPEGSRKFLLQLENEASGKTLLLCPHDLATLSSWEHAISSVLADLGKELADDKKGQRGAEGTRSTTINTVAPARRSVVQMSSLHSSGGQGAEENDIDSTAAVLKSGYVCKQGHRVQSWTKRWFTLTSTMLSYYTDDTLQMMKGTLPIDQYASVTRRMPPRRSSTSMQLGRQHLLCLYVGGSATQRTDLLMSMDTEDARLAWECALVGAALRCKLAAHVVAVRVMVCDDYEPFVVRTEEPVYAIKLYRFGKRLSCEYFHFADLRKLYKKLQAVASVFSLSESFPRTYKRNSFGVQLGDIEAESRRFQLEQWVQEALDRYPELEESKTEHAVIRDIIAQLVGCSAKHLSIITNPSLQNYSAMVSEQDDSDDDHDDRTPIDDRGTAAAPDPADSSVIAHPEGARRPPHIPEKSSDLKAFSLYALAVLCVQHHFDCWTFKAHKHYLKALLETYQKRLPYLHDKDARGVIGHLAGAVGGDGSKEGALDPDTLTEIDNIFSDLLYKLKVEESLMSTLQVVYTSAEKVRCFSQAVAVWDAVVTFTQEDALLLQRLSCQMQIDGFLLLTLKYRLSLATPANQIMERFCAARGVTYLVQALDLALDQSPVNETDAACVLQTLKCLRVVLDAGYGLVVLDTRGAVDGCANALQVSHPAVVVEVLDLLSELVIAVGEEGPQRVCQALLSAAVTLRQKPFELFVVLCRDGNVSVQCAVMNLINALMVYEKDIKKRMALRQSLHDLDFDKVCNDLLKDYRLGNNSESSTAKEEVTVPAVSTPPSDNVVAEGIEEGEDDFEEAVESTHYTRLRPGVRVADLSVQECFADNEESVIHPQQGLMEGFAIEIVLESARDTDTDIVADARESVHSLGKFVSDRLSLSRLSGGRHSMGAADGRGEIPSRNKQMDFRARRIWYRLSDQTLSWSDSFESYEPLGSVSVDKMLEVVEFGSLSTEILGSLQNCFSIVCKNGITLHMCTDSRTIKLQWLVALRAAIKKHSLLRLPFRLPDEKMFALSALAGRRRDFENHLGIYKSLAVEDLYVLYHGEISDIVEGRVTATDSGFDPVRIAAFINYELKCHRNGGKLFIPLQELCSYIYNCYAPRPPSKDDGEIDGRLHPRAVPPSPDPPPRPPPLPFMPDPKPDKKAQVKVKQLFWTPVKPANVVNTIWMDLEEPEVSWPTVDTQFAAVQARTNVKTKQGAAEGPVKAKAVSLFDSRRTQNVAIACGKLKKSPEEIYDMILAMDAEELTGDINDTVQKLLLPTTDELTALKAYTGDVQDLDYTGKLFSKLALIDRLDQRLSVQRIMLSWFEQADVVIEQLNTIMAAVTEFSGDQSLPAFRHVLATILSVGNYMNGGTRRGRCHGYRLELLLKLRDVKRTGGRGTLLHFIVSTCSLSASENGGEGVGEPFYATWKDMWLAPKVNMTNLEVLVRELQCSLDMCIREVEQAEEVMLEDARGPLVERLCTCD